MLKQLITFIVFVCLLITNLDSQVPNGDFEFWELDNNIEEPEEWDSNSSQEMITIEKVEKISNGGMYAMKISSLQEDSTGNRIGLARTIFPIQYTSRILEMIIRIDSLHEGNVEMIVSQIDNGNFSQVGYRKFAGTLKQAERVSFLVEYMTGDSLQIEFVANGIKDEDGTVGYAEIIFDDVDWGLEGANEEFDINDKTNVFPNPSNGIIKIDGLENHNYYYRLYDMQSRLVSEGSISNSSLNIQKRGWYALYIYNDEESYVKKVFVE